MKKMLSVLFLLGFAMTVSFAQNADAVKKIQKKVEAESYQAAQQETAKAEAQQAFEKAVKQLAALKTRKPQYKEEITTVIHQHESFFKTCINFVNAQFRGQTVQFSLEDLLNSVMVEDQDLRKELRTIIDHEYMVQLTEGRIAKMTISQIAEWATRETGVSLQPDIHTVFDN